MEASLRKENTRIRDRLAALRCRNALDHVAVCYDPIAAANQHSEQAKHLAPRPSGPKTPPSQQSEHTKPLAPRPSGPKASPPLNKPSFVKPAPPKPSNSAPSAALSSSRRKESGHSSVMAPASVAVLTPNTTEHSVATTASTSRSTSVEPPETSPSNDSADVMVAMKILIRTVLEEKEETVTRVNCYRALQKYALAQAEIRKLTAELRKLKREKGFDTAAATQDASLSNERIQVLSTFLQDLETIQREQKESFHLAMESKDAELKQHQEALTHRTAQVEALTRQLNDVQAQSARYEEEIRHLHAALQQRSDEAREQSREMSRLDTVPPIPETEEADDDAKSAAQAHEELKAAKLLRSWRNVLVSDQAPTNKPSSLLKPTDDEDGSVDCSSLLHKSFSKSPVPIETTALSYSQESEHSLQEDELFLDDCVLDRKSPMLTKKPLRKSPVHMASSRPSPVVVSARVKRHPSPAPNPPAATEDSDLSLKSEEIFLGSTPPKPSSKKPMRKSPVPPVCVGESDDMSMASGELTSCLPPPPKAVQPTARKPSRKSPLPPKSMEDSEASLNDLFVEASPSNANVDGKEAHRQESEASMQSQEIFLESHPNKPKSLPATPATGTEVAEGSLGSYEIFDCNGPIRQATPSETKTATEPPMKTGRTKLARSPAPSAMRGRNSPRPQAAASSEVSEESLECGDLFDPPAKPFPAYSPKVVRKGSPIPPKRAAQEEEASMEDSLQDFHSVPDQKTIQSPKSKSKKAEGPQTETAPESPSITASFVPVPHEAVTEEQMYAPVRNRTIASKLTKSPDSRVTRKVIGKSPAPWAQKPLDVSDAGANGPIQEPDASESSQGLIECDEELDLDDLVLSRSHIEKQRQKYGSESSLQSDLFERLGGHSSERSLDGIQEPGQPSSDSNHAPVEPSRAAPVNAETSSADPAPEPDESDTIDSVTGVSYLVNSDGALSDLMPDLYIADPVEGIGIGDAIALPDETVEPEAEQEPRLQVLSMEEAPVTANEIEPLELAAPRCETASPSFEMDSLRFLHASIQDSGIRQASSESIHMDTAPPDRENGDTSEAALSVAAVSEKEVTNESTDGEIDPKALLALAAALEQSRSRSDVLQRELESLTFRLENEEAKLKEFDSLQAELRVAQETIQQNNCRVQELETLLEEKDAGLAQARQKIHLLEAYVVEDLVPPDDVVRECQISQGDRHRGVVRPAAPSSSSGAEVTAAREEEREAARAAMGELEGQLEAAHARIAQLEEESRKLTAHSTDFAAVLQASRDNQRRLAEKTEKCAGLVLERDRLKRKLHEAKGRALDLEQELERTQSLLEELQDRASSLSDAGDRASLAELRDELDRTLARATETSLELAECRTSLNEVTEQLKAEQRRVQELEASLASEMDRSSNTHASSRGTSRGGGMFASLNLSNHSAAAGRLLATSSHGTWRAPAVAADGGDAIVRRLQQRVAELEMQNDIYEAERTSYKAAGPYKRHDAI